VKDNDVDLLSQIYQEMNETGKEKLKKVSDQIMNIWSTVHDEGAKSSYSVEKKSEGTITNE
jgi:hypothetical protein